MTDHAQSPTHPILDSARLDESSGGDPSLRQELIALYLEDSRERLDELRREVPSGDLETLMRAAHGLKGASSAMGLAEASAAFLRIEHMARAGQRDDMARALDEAARAWERGCSRLRSLAA